jgi:putative endonuclease
MIPSRTPGFVYIITNDNHSVLSVGVTSDPVHILRHRRKSFLATFFRRYRTVDKLVYYEKWATIRAAISRERQLKQGSRLKKEILIEEVNPKWADLSAEVTDWL